MGIKYGNVLKNKLTFPLERVLKPDLKLYKRRIIKEHICYVLNDNIYLLFLNVL